MSVHEKIRKKVSYLREILLSNHIRFNKPQDKLYAGQIDRMDNFVLRYRALQNQYEQHKSPMRGLCGMRAGLDSSSVLHCTRSRSSSCPSCIYWRMK